MAGALGSLTGLCIAAAGAFQNEAASGVRMGSVVVGGSFQQSGKGLRYGAAGAQKFIQEDGAIRTIALEDAGIEASLAAEGGVEAGRVDAKGAGEVGDADRVVAAGVEEVLGRRHGLFRVKAAGAAAGTGRICSHSYKIP
jgi:hypothetical protein